MGDVVLNFLFSTPQEKEKKSPFVVPPFQTIDLLVG
jgi:hypothetical protein